MSGESSRLSRNRHTTSSPTAATPRRPQDLHRAASSRSTASSSSQQHTPTTYTCVYHKQTQARTSSSSRPGTPSTKPAKPAKPSPLSTTMSSQQSKTSYYSPHTGQPYYLFPNMQSPDPSSQEIDLQSQPWMMTTMIEDDDLTFGGKPLSDWYEEDRRRLSLGDDSAPSPDSWRDEEERRGRQRQRPSYQTSSNGHGHHKHHHKKSDKKH